MGIHQQPNCYPCPAGKFASNIGSSLCYDCSPGFYSGHGASTCQICSVGHYCPGGTPQIPCPAGLFSPTTGGVSCDSCPSGLFSKEGSLSCADCDAGHHCPGGVDQIPCPPGSFTADVGQQFCVPCADGSFANGTGNTHCEVCKEKMYSEEGATRCKQCPTHWNAEKFQGYEKCMKLGIQLLKLKYVACILTCIVQETGACSKSHEL